MEFDQENSLPSNMHRIAISTGSKIERGRLVSKKSLEQSENALRSGCIFAQEQKKRGGEAQKKKDQVVSQPADLI